MCITKQPKGGCIINSGMNHQLLTVSVCCHGHNVMDVTDSLLIVQLFFLECL